MVQGVLNDLWKKLQVDYLHRTNLSGRQIILIILGGIMWVLTIIGMAIPD